MNKKFPWGEVVKVHDIAGKYQVTEYICGAFEDAGRRQFHTLNCTFDTLVAGRVDAELTSPDCCAAVRKTE